MRFGRLDEALSCCQDEGAGDLSLDKSHRKVHSKEVAVWKTESGYR